MGTYVTIFLGVLAVMAGIYGILVTWPLVWHVLVAVFLVVLVIGGVLAVSVGLGELRDRRATK